MKDNSEGLCLRQRVWVISSPDANCAEDVIWGRGTITHIGSRTEVMFDNGSGGMFPHDCIYPEVTSPCPEKVSWREVSGYLRVNGWEVTYSPIDGLPAFKWRSPDGISGSDFRSNHPDSPPEAVMAAAFKAGLVRFIELSSAVIGG